MDTEIGLVPLFQSSIQTMSRSDLFKYAGACRYISIVFCVITSLKKHCGNSAGIYMWLSQLTHCFEYLYFTSSIQDSFESAVFYKSWKYVSDFIHNFLI